MPGLQRTISTRSTRLKTRASPYTAGVTLFESDASDPASPEKKVVNILEDAVEKGAAVMVASTKKAAGKSPRPKKAAAKTPRKQKPIPQMLAVPHPAPLRWQEAWNTIKEMRSRITAPVDTMGCDMAHLKEKTTPKNKRFTTLVSLILSPQTTDQVVDAAVSNLREILGGSLSVEAVIAADDKTIEDAIKTVGMWSKKSKFLKGTAQRLRDHFDSDVPKTPDDLCSLPGVGPKVANLTLQVAWGLNKGIGVDTHVHRITNLLGWHTPVTKTPEQSRLNLQSWLPKELHPEINHMLVGFGQTICPASPRCDLCDLSTKGLCPSALKVSTKTRKPIIFSPKASTSDSPPKIEIELEETEEKPVLDTMPDPSLEVKADETW